MVRLGYTELLGWRARTGTRKQLSILDMGMLVGGAGIMALHALCCTPRGLLVTTSITLTEN